MHHENHRRMSGFAIVLLSAAAAFGAYMFVKELPALRRYIRMERM